MLGPLTALDVLKNTITVEKTPIREEPFVSVKNIASKNPNSFEILVTYSSPEIALRFTKELIIETNKKLNVTLSIFLAFFFILFFSIGSRLVAQQ